VSPYLVPSVKTLINTGEKMNPRKIIFIMLSLIWMFCIFSFSSQEADDSTELSNDAGKMVGEIFVPDFDTWEVEKQDEFAESIDYPVRKTAHASEYALLALLLSGIFVDFNRIKSKYRDKYENKESTSSDTTACNRKLNSEFNNSERVIRVNHNTETAGIKTYLRKGLLAQLALCLLVAALYASTDEFHQLFVEGRAGRFTDVLIDSSGALTALIILFVLLNLVKINKEAKKNI
jgi:VanZ family protein